MNRMSLIKIIHARFPKQSLAISEQEYWRNYAEESSEEVGEAYLKFSHMRWWEVPDEMLLSGYGGIGFLPDRIFSYYLPGCIIRCIAHTVSAKGILSNTLFCMAGDSYYFQTLNARQILACGWFLYCIKKVPDLAYDGRVSIICDKLSDKARYIENSREKESLDRILFSKRGRLSG